MEIRIPVRNTTPLRHYRRHPRRPQKPPVKRTHDPRRPPGSVARWLALRQQAL